MTLEYYRNTEPNCIATSSSSTHSGVFTPDVTVIYPGQDLLCRYALAVAANNTIAYSGAKFCGIYSTRMRRQGRASPRFGPFNLLYSGTSIGPNTIALLQTTAWCFDFGRDVLLRHSFDRIYAVYSAVPIATGVGLCYGSNSDTMSGLGSMSFTANNYSTDSLPRSFELVTTNGVPDQSRGTVSYTLFSDNMFPVVRPTL